MHALRAALQHGHGQSSVARHGSELQCSALQVVCKLLNFFENIAKPTHRMTASPVAADVPHTKAYSPTLSLRCLKGCIGAVVEHIDLSAPQSEGVFAWLRDALDRQALLLFREQSLSPDQLIDFSRKFGPLQEVAQKHYQMADKPEIFIIGNAEEGGRRIADKSVGRLWHSDQSFNQHPAMGSVLYGCECPPEGADTLFGNMFKAYDALPEETQRRIEGLHAVHSFAQYYELLRERDPSQPPLTPERRAAYPDSVHPLVRKHPRTGRKALYVNPAYVTRIVELSEPESRALLDELFAHQVRDEFVYRHKWQEGDVLFWQNVGLIHKGTAFDESRYTRRMHRTTVAALPDDYAHSLLDTDRRLAS